MADHETPGYVPDHDPKFAPIAAGIMAYWRCTREQAEEFTRLILTLEHLKAQRAKYDRLAVETGLMSEQAPGAAGPS